jgi:hypothetical protein
MAEETKPAGQTPAEAAAASVAPDQVTADLLRKHAANEKLSPREYGLLGAMAKKAKNIFAGKAERGAQQTQAGNGQPSALAAVAQAEAPNNGMAPVPVNPRLVQNCTDLLITETNTFLETLITSRAKRAGATDKSASDIAAQISCPAPSKRIMVETSPQVAEALGINDRHFPLFAFFGALTLWGSNAALTVVELGKLEKKLKAITEKKPEPAKAP